MQLTADVAGMTDLVEIGRGGFGAVYRATERDLERPVAVKVLYGALDEAGRRRFDRERRAMGKVCGHPHVVTVHRTGLTDSGQPYIVMELMHGGSMRDRLERDGPLPWSEVVQVGMDIASALEVAHAAGICHRDVKPGNLLVSSHGVVKLADFGMALMDEAAQTRSAMVTASLAHAPPEVIAGMRSDERSDVYSLGSTLHELMRGSAPFARDGEQSLAPMLARIALEPPPSLAAAGVPRAVCDVVERAMAKDPADRPASADELRLELARALTFPDSAAQRTTRFAPDALAPPMSTPPPDADASGPQRPSTDRVAPVEASGLPSAELAPTPPRPRRRARILARGVIGLLATVGVVAIGLVVADLLTGGPHAGAGSVSLMESAGAHALLAPAEDGAAGLDDYDEYVSVTDDHGTLTAEVPAAWSDVNTSGYLVAAEQIAGFFGSADHSGAAITFSRVADADPDRLLDDAVEPDCDAVERVDYDDGTHVGRADVWTRCGDDGTASFVRVVAEPAEPDDIVIVASLQLTQDRDIRAAQRIMGSIAVDPRTA